jgi:hypothetical protein
MTEEIKSKCDDVLEHEFRASETIDELVNEHDIDVVEREMLKSIKELIARVNNPDREMTCYVLAYQIGRALESEEILAFAEDKVQDLKQGR